MSRYDIYKGISILVVDDNRALLKFFKIHLGSSFSSVIVVGSTKDAMKIIATHPVDVILTDYHMAVADNHQLLEAVRKHDDTIPMAAVTEMSLAQLADEGKLQDFDAYLAKPFELSELQQVIEKIVRLRKEHLSSTCEVLSLESHPLRQAKAAQSQSRAGKLSRSSQGGMRKTS